MIAIDTNIIIRYLWQDDKAQAALAVKLIDGRQQVLIADIALIECIWVLSGKKYNLNKESILMALSSLIQHKNIIFENKKAVWTAFNLYKNSQAVKVGAKKKDLDFADALILEKSRAVINEQGQPFNGLYSFDKAAQQLKEIKTPK